MANDYTIAGHHDRPYSLLQNGRPPLPCWRPKWRYGLDRYSLESVKLKRTVEVVFESEYHHCIIQECDPCVRYYCEYPLELNSRDQDGKTVMTKPDMWICLWSGLEQIREVKTQEQEKKSKRQIDAQRFWCAKAPIEHKLIIKEKDLPEILVNNCIEIFPYLSKASRPDIKGEILAKIDLAGGFTLGSLRSESRLETDMNYAAALQLLCSGVLVAPLKEQPFSQLFLRRADDARPQEPLT